MTIDVDLPKNRQGRFYHINCGPGDLAPYILTCGDPDRARRIARSFDRVEVKRRNREFLTYTGIYHGIRVSVIATGIGAPASAIAIVEAAQCVAPATFIRLGSTGALQDYVNLGDMIITSEALREENTTHFYAPAEIKAAAHPDVLAALREAAISLEVPYHVGVTCTS
ncbi:MAG: nucleoside phosphorylase, partial [Deltaproteobacteria bacterium]|nr:nucleoside phosphorylase [Deltaproteobacteria bacterium]